MPIFAFKVWNKTFLRCQWFLSGARY